MGYLLFCSKHGLDYQWTKRPTSCSNGLYKQNMLCEIDIKIGAYISISIYLYLYIYLPTYPPLSTPISIYI